VKPAAPTLAAPFRLAGEHIAIDLPGGHALFSTRRGGASAGPFRSLNLGLTVAAPEPARHDDPQCVAANRARLAEAVGVPVSHFAHSRQVHGTIVAAVRDLPDGRWAAARPGEREADGQATALMEVAPVVLAADCLPVALIAPEAVAMVHAGWRGLAGGVLAAGVAALRDLGARGPVAAAIGPGAGRCCYAVGEEVHAAFAHRGAQVRDGDRLDLKAIAARELAEAGVGEVHDVGLCTICREELFFSHRRDGGRTGRQAGVAWRA
jgi:YfiH family protein